MRVAGRALACCCNGLLVVSKRDVKLLNLDVDILIHLCRLLSMHKWTKIIQ